MDFADAENGNVPKRADVVIGPYKSVFSITRLKWKINAENSCVCKDCLL